MDWRFFSFLFVVIISIVNVIVLITIKVNDIRHLSQDVSELKQDVKTYIKKLYSLAQRVAKIEGKISKK
jgi:inner membrane protein involved in colicin E2 resistance